MPENPSRSRTANHILSRRSREDYEFQSHHTPTRNRQICEAQRRIDDQRARCNGRSFKDARCSRPTIC